MTSVWDVIATGAARESPLWGDALLPPERRELVPAFSPLAPERFALAIETIYEGYLLHHARPRLFAAADPGTAILLGDYLYAHGLVRLAEHEDVGAVADFAELISLCAQVRAAGENGDAGRLDGPAWAATVALLGSSDGRLEPARAALRLKGDPEPLERLAREVAGEPAVARALDTHRRRVD